MLRGVAPAVALLVLVGCGARTGDSAMRDLASDGASSPAEPDGASGAVGPAFDAGTAEASSSVADDGPADAASATDASCTAPLGPACEQTPTGQVVTQTVDAFRAAISHRWLQCGSQSVFGRNSGQVGLEITADGHWYNLYPSDGGGLVRSAGVGAEGTWMELLFPQSSDDPQPFQLNLYVPGEGEVITHPVLASTPRAMTLDNEGVFIGNYVLDPSGPGGGPCR